MENRRMPGEIQGTLSVWIGYKRRWWNLHYVLGIIALVCSITVASGPQLQQLVPSSWYLFEILAWIAALTVGLITFLIPSKKARA